MFCLILVIEEINLNNASNKVCVSNAKKINISEIANASVKIQGGDKVK